jgi:hypothetical protein
VGNSSEISKDVAFTMTKYARDEFDRVPETSTRQGVHRAVAESRRGRRLAPILAVGAAALAVGLVAFLFLPKLGLSSAGNTVAAVSAEQGGSSAAASPEPAASTPAPSTPAATATPSPSATPSDPPAPTAAAAAVDKTQPVAIFNGTTTGGLASRVGGTVSSAGWKLGTLGNWGGVPQQRSVIFYKGAAQAANAEALGELLGIQTVVESAEFQLPLVVVLGPGFQ